VSRIFGHVPVDEELQVHINDQRVAVTKVDDLVVECREDQFSGAPIAFQIFADWPFAVASNKLPAG
jgi:hypothetical protein